MSSRLVQFLKSLDLQINFYLVLFLLGPTVFISGPFISYQLTTSVLLWFLFVNVKSSFDNFQIKEQFLKNFKFF